MNCENKTGEVTLSLGLSASNRRKLAGAVSVLSAMQIICPLAGLAAELNLNSTDQTFTVDANHQGTVNLTVNGETKSVGAGASLTAAEYAAFINVLHGQEQTLNIGAGGIATGGTLNLTPQLATTITGLVVPTNVVIIHDFGAGSALNLTGNLVNSGTFYAVSTNSAITNAVLNAANLTNNQGALLTSVLPTGGLAGFVGAISNLSLTLNITNALTNMGAITSAGNLTVNAGSIYNQLPAGASGVSPIMQAVNNLNLNATLGNLTNSGILAATTGNVNLSSLNNLVVNNVNGSIQALMGNINVHQVDDILNTLNVNATGGNWLSEQLNINAGYGVVDFNINDVTGQVNVNAAAANLGAATPNLNLGNINIQGDPTWFNTGGNVLLSGPIVASGASPNIAILASGNIVSVSGATVIDSSSAQTGGNAGTITLVAGANFSAGSGSGTNDTTTTLTINGGSTTGGGIYLDGTAPTGFSGTPSAITGLTSAGVGANNSGGNITMVSYAGTGAGSGVVRLPSAVTVTSGGSGTGANGSITILAGATSGAAVSIGGLQTSGSYATPGTITIASATPVITGTGQVTILGGAILGGSGSWVAGTPQSTTITTGRLVASGMGGSDAVNQRNAGSGGTISLLSAGNISTGSLRAFGGGGGADTQAPGKGGNGGSISLLSNGGSITINGEVNASGGGGGASSRSVVTAGVGGSGGSITLTATGDLVVSGPVLAAGGGAGGQLLSGSAGGTGGGGSFGGGGSGADGGQVGGGGGGGGFTGGGGGGAAGGPTGGAGGGGGYATGGGGGGGGAASSSATGFGAGGGGGGGGGGIGVGGGGGGATTVGDNTVPGGGGSGGAGGGDGLPGTSTGSGLAGVGGTSAGGGIGANGSPNLLNDGDGGNGGAGGGTGTGTGAGGVAFYTGGNGGLFGVGGGGSSTSPAGGDVGTSGAGGQISLTGRRVVVSGTIGTAAGDWPGFASSPYASQSISALGTGGVITVSTTQISLSNFAYSANANYASTARSETAPSITTLASFGVGANFMPTGGAAGDLVAGNTITLNGTSAGTSVTSGTFQNTTNSYTLIEQNGNYTVGSGGALTPAEFVALVNAAQGTSGPLLNGSAVTGGAAYAGTIAITSANIPAGNFTNLTLPSGVTIQASVDSLTYSGIATINGTMNIAGASPTLNIGNSLAISGSLNFSGTGTSSLIVQNSITGTGTIGATTPSLSVTSTAGNIGAVGTPLSFATLTGVNLNLTASAGSITVGNLVTAGAGGNAVSSFIDPASVGGSGGAITLLAQGDITTGSLRSFGGGGGSGGIATGGAGGKIDLSTQGTISIGGEVNSSGGGGGASTAGDFGVGGFAGDILISAGGALTISGPVLAAGGGRGGTSLTNTGGAGGGGSFGGGGGGSVAASIPGAGGGGGYFGGGGGASLSGGGGGGGGSTAGGGGGGGGANSFAGGVGGGGGGGGGLGIGGSGADGATGGTGGAGGASGVTGLVGAGKAGAGGLTSGTGGAGLKGSSGVSGIGGAGGLGGAAGSGVPGGPGAGGYFGMAGGTSNVATGSPGSNAGTDGAAGNIKLSGATITLSGTIGSASGNWVGFASSPFANDSINAQGTSGGLITITATGGGISTPGWISGNAVHFVAGGGNVGTTLISSGAQVVNSPVLSVSASGFSNIRNTSANPVSIVGSGVTGSSSAGSSFIVNASSNLTVTDKINAQTINLISSGTLRFSNNATAAQDLFATSSTVVVDAGVALNGSTVVMAPFGTAPFVLTNDGTITATTGNVTLSSSSGTDLTIGGAGTLSAAAGKIELTAVTSGTTANKILINGNQNYNGPTYLNATGVNQSVEVAAGVVSIGNSLVLINSPTFNEIGDLQGNPLVFSPAAGQAGTIANSLGNVDLNQVANLTFTGQNLAIIAAGSIINSGGAKTINLSTPNNVSGGTLTLIAGYNFTPATAGQVGPNATAYTMTTPGTGSISLGSVNINTSSTGGIGGSVLAVANGAITLGTVNTSGAGIAGNVTLVGTSTTTGAITATGAIGGNVTITASAPQTVGTVTVTNGSITSGSFAPTAATGNIFVNSINAGTGNINLTTGGAGLIVQLSGALSTIGAGQLTVNVGTSNIFMSVASSNLALSSTTGSAFINASSLVNLASSNLGGSLSFNSSNTVGVATGATVNIAGTLSLSGGTGIIFGNNATVNSGGNATLSTFGANAGVVFGNNAALTAGSLNGTAPPSPAGLVSSNISKMGSIQITAGGAGGITAGTGLKLTSTAGDLTLNSFNVGADIALGDNYALQVNGGNFSMSSGRHITLGVPANTAGAIVARTLNGFQGNVTTTSTGITTFQAATSTVAGGNLMVNTFGLTSAITFNTGASVTATNATLSSAGNGGVILSGFTVVNNLSASSGGALTSNGVINAGNVTFNTLGMNQPLTVNQSITVTPSGFNTMPTIALNSSGNILVNGVLSGNRVNLTSSGKAAAAITLDQPINGTGANNQVTFNALSGAAIVNNVGAASTITANVLNINSAGVVGVPGSPTTRINTQVDTINLSGFGASNNVAISELSGLTVGSFGSATVGGSLEIFVADGNLTYQSINAGNRIELTNFGSGNITQLAGGLTSNLTGGMRIFAAGGAAVMTLNGTFFAGGSGNVSVSTSGTIGAIGNVTVNNGLLEVVALDGSITQTNFTTLSTNTGNIIVNARANALLNGFVRTNVSGDISLTSVLGSVTTRGISTGATGPNNISVLISSAGGSYTALPNSFNSAGMNGNIVIDATQANSDVILTDASFNTSGTGSISVTAGRNIVLGRLSSGAGLNLTSGQSTDGSITSAGSLTALSASNGTINITQNGLTGLINLGGDVSTVTSGGINITAQGSGGITLRNVRTGLTGSNTINVTANSGAITQQPFTSITAGGASGININAAQNLSLQSIAAGGTLNLGTPGNLTLASFAMLRATNINSATTGSSTLNGSLTATGGTINLSASTLVINQAVSTMNGGINISAFTGTVTTGASGSLSATGGTVNVSANNGATGAVILGAGVMVSGGQNFAININSGRNLTTAALTNTSPSGSINLTANVGVLQINGSILGAGDVNIRHNGIAAGDRIAISPFASIQALAPSAPQGNVTIAITNGAVTNIAGTPPLGGTVSQITSGGGQIFFGPGQFTNTGFTTLNAKGANITFYRDPAAADGVNAIQTNSNFIFADPPVGAPVAVPGIVGRTHTGSPASGASVSGPQSAISGDGLVRSSIGVAPVQLPLYNSSLPACDTLRNSNALVGDFADSGNIQQNVRNVVTETNKTLSQITDMVVTGFVSKKATMTGGAMAYTRTAANTNLTRVNAATYDLSSGEALVSANSRVNVLGGVYAVDVAPGAVVHIVKDGNVLKVRSLCDSVGKAICIHISGKTIKLSPGEEIAVSTNEQFLEHSLKQDHIGRRESHKFVVGDNHIVVKSELSAVSLIQKSTLLGGMYAKGSPADRSVLERVMKMTAALFQVTGKRGAYSEYEPTKVRAKDSTLSYAASDR